MHSGREVVSMMVWLSSQHLTNDVIRSVDRVSNGVTDGDLPDVLGGRRREEGNNTEQCQRTEHHVRSWRAKREESWQ